MEVDFGNPVILSGISAILQETVLQKRMIGAQRILTLSDFQYLMMRLLLVGCESCNQIQMHI